MLKQLGQAMPLMLGREAAQMTQVVSSVGSAFLYGLTSISMAFHNKLVLNYYNYDYPIVIMTCQMAVTFLIVSVLHRAKLLELSKLTKENLRQFILPCFFYTLNGVLSLSALGSMNITMYSVVKRNGPLCTMILSTIVLKKGIPGYKVITGVLMMSLGCIIAAVGDMTFDVQAYTLGFGSVISQALYLIFLQKLSDTFSTLDTLFMNSVLSFPILLMCSFVFGEAQQAMQFDRYIEIGFILMYTLLLVMGSFLNFTLFLCNSTNSALTTSVVGTLKSVAQTTVGLFTFGGVAINVALITGVTINLSGGIVYTYAKYLEGKLKKDMKKIQSEASLQEVVPHADNGGVKSDHPDLIHSHQNTDNQERKL